MLQKQQPRRRLWGMTLEPRLTVMWEKGDHVQVQCYAMLPLVTCSIKLEPSDFMKRARKWSVRRVIECCVMGHGIRTTVVGSVGESGPRTSIPC
jgi:hypothetical protein